MQLNHVIQGESRPDWFRRFIGAIGTRYRRRAQFRALEALDDRTLADIGLRRTEIGSLIAELRGEAEPTRVRAGADTGRRRAANGGGRERPNRQTAPRREAA